MNVNAVDFVVVGFRRSNPSIPGAPDAVPCPRRSSRSWTFAGGFAGRFAGGVRFVRSIKFPHRAAAQQPAVPVQRVATYTLPPKVGFGKNWVTMRSIAEDVDDSLMSLSEGGRQPRRILPDMESSFASNFSPNLSSNSDQSMARSLIGDGVGSYQPTYQRTNFLDGVPVANFD